MNNKKGYNKLMGFICLLLLSTLSNPVDAQKKRSSDFIKFYSDTTDTNEIEKKSKSSKTFYIFNCHHTS